MNSFNGFLIFILATLIGGYLLNIIIENLNLKRLTPELPNEFKGFYESDKYAKSQEYTRENTKFGFIKETFDLMLILLFIFIGGFNWIDYIARGYGFGEVITGIIFALVLMIGSSLIHQPFSIYSTFRIEEKFGFNRTTWKTYIIDFIKGTLLSIVIGMPIIALIIWFFNSFGNLAWLYLWGVLTLIQIFLMYIAPIAIMPLFNKFRPLEDGELKEEIEEFAGKNKFKMKGIFTMDGSKRSSKSNAFFTGYGNSRRIVLFDTLIEKHSVSELIAVLAHEIGHFKLKHILKNIIVSILTSGMMLFIMSLFINNRALFDAFKMDELSIYASLIFFSFLYSPISLIFGILGSIISRKHEYQADAFAFKSTEDAESMIISLKKLSVDNLSNLTPHPLKVFLEYSHPPVLQRIKALRNLTK